MSSFTSANTVGSMKYPLSPTRFAARHELALSLLAGVDVAHHFVELLLVHLRALFGICVERIADRALFGTRRAALHELVVGLLFHEQYANPRSSIALD